MTEETMIKDARQIDYNVLNQIHEHAKQYEHEPDKKTFLKNVSAYEQKLILLQSTKPYDVLSYLNELSLKSTILVLDELTSEEISKILFLFSSEDKKNFYNNFSNLELVNKFIVNDKNSFKYVKDLSLERKIDIMDSSSPKTVKASEEVLISMNEKEREIASTSITNVEASVALSTAEFHIENHVDTDFRKNEHIENAVDILEQEEKIDKQETEKVLNEIINKDNPVRIEDLKTEFLKSKLQFYIQNNEQFKNINIDGEINYELLPPELQAIVDTDFSLENPNKEQKDDQQPSEKQDKLVETSEIETPEASEKLSIDSYEKYSIVGNGETTVSIVSNPQKIEQFQQTQQKSEHELIKLVQEKVAQNSTNLTLEEHSKTL